MQQKQFLEGSSQRYRPSSGRKGGRKDGRKIPNNLTPTPKRIRKRTNKTQSQQKEGNNKDERGNK